MFLSFGTTLSLDASSLFAGLCVPEKDQVSQRACACAQPAKNCQAEVCANGKRRTPTPITKALPQNVARCNFVHGPQIEECLQKQEKVGDKQRGDKPSIEEGSVETGERRPKQSYRRDQDEALVGGSILAGAVSKKGENRNMIISLNGTM